MELFRKEIDDDLSAEVLKVRELWKDPWKTNTKELMVFLRVTSDFKLLPGLHTFNLDTESPCQDISERCQSLHCGISGKLWGLASGTHQGKKLVI